MWWSLTAFEDSREGLTLREAWLELANNEPSRALLRLDAHLRLRPDDAEALLWRAVAGVHLKEPDAAQRDARRSAELRPTDPRPHVVLHYIALRLLDLDGAARHEKESERKAPGAYAQRGELFRMLGSDRQAAEDFERALEAQPDDPRLVAVSASTLFELDRKQEPEALKRIAQVDRILEAAGHPLPHDPLPPFWSKKLLKTYVNSRIAAASDHFEAERFDRALELLRRVLVNRPAEPRAHFRLTKLLYDTRRHAEALQAARLWGEHVPREDSRPIHYVGKSLARLGRHGEALDALSRALELGHGSLALKARAESHYSLGQFDLAHADINAFLAQNPDHTSALITRALAAVHSGRVDEARAALTLFESEARFQTRGYRIYLRQLRVALRRAQTPAGPP